MKKTLYATLLVFLFVLSPMTYAQESTSRIGPGGTRTRPEPAQANSANIHYDTGGKGFSAIITDNTAFYYDSRSNAVTTKETTDRNEVLMPLYIGTEILPFEEKSGEGANASPELVVPYFSMVLESRTSGYGWYINYGWPNFQTLLTNMGNQGFRIENLDTYGRYSYNYAGTWVQDAKGWAWVLNYTDVTTFINILNGWPNGTTRYRPIDFAVSPNGAQMWYGAVAVADNYGFGWVFNEGSPTSYINWINSQYGNSRRIVDIGFCADASGNLKCSAISADAGYPQQVAMNQSVSNFVALNNQYIGQGYRLVDFDKYYSGGVLYYAGLWNKDGIGYAYALDHNSSSVFQTTVNNYISQGFKPIVVDVYDRDWENDVETEAQPIELVLQQNYPNPFNPMTTIRFGLPQRSYVSLAVFNMLGQQMAQLVSSEIEVGYHEVTFDASDLPSGVYFYRLQAGSYVGTRKLSLVR